MDALRWKEISDLAAIAADTAPAEREALYRGRPDLRDEVESLLRFLEAGSGPLDSLPSPASPQSLAGQQIGAYRILRELGQGGMGEVWLARRSDPQLEQLVALKLARVSFQSEFFARRFIEERQILARLEHANIARLLDGGLTDGGAPYLVMQYVEGVPLDEWCATNELDTAGRIQLFLKVCAAVQYAHEHLVVHRDLKPANILVTAEGEPMLLDFGTARLTETSEQSGATQTALPMMTLRYASPEQVDGLSGTTRSDVYALGVVLYELLTGRWPYVDEPVHLRVIAESEPIAPSKVNGERARELAGDLDSILLKALEKKPARRYGTVAQLADDLRRYLAGEPVTARNATWSYRTGKFLRRHRWSAAAAAVLVLTLGVATGVSLRQARIAERERAKAEAVAGFVERLLGASRSGGVTPLASRGRDLRVVEVIDDAAKSVGDEFKDNPEVEAGLRSTIASTYMALGQNREAAPHVERAVALAESAHGENHAATARALTARGRLRMAAGNYAGAQDDFNRALRTLTMLGSPDLPFLHSLMGEGAYRTGDLKSARQHFEASLAGMRLSFGTKHLATATLINSIGVIADEEGDAPAAERYFQEAADILRAMPGPPGNTVYPLFGLQRVHFLRGELDRAKLIGEEAYRIALRQGGETHRTTATALSVLSLTKAHLSERDAENGARKAVQICQAVYPAGHLEIARASNFLARVLLINGKPAEAESLLREAYAMARNVYPKPNWRPAESLLFLGQALAAQGRLEEGRQSAQAGLREFETVFPGGHPRVDEARRVCRSVERTGKD